MEEESAILSAKERGFAAPRSHAGNIIKGIGRGSGFTPREEFNGNKGLGRGSGFIPRGEFRGFRPPGRRVAFNNNGNNVRNAHVVTEDVARGHVVMEHSRSNIRCHAYGAFGHISRFCRRIDLHGEKLLVWETGTGNRGAAPL
jgi:hypothetical protein